MQRRTWDLSFRFLEKKLSWAPGKIQVCFYLDPDIFYQNMLIKIFNANSPWVCYCFYGLFIAYELNHVIAGTFSDPLVKMLPQEQSHLCVLSVCWGLQDPWIYMGWEQRPIWGKSNPINTACNNSASFPGKTLKFSAKKALHLKLTKTSFS